MSIVDAQGAVVASYNYDPYGNLISDEPAANTIGHLNPIRYRGYVYDPESGFYYLQSRYYDPEVGRFLNADTFASTGQGILGNNMFAYCGNNPISHWDPLGTYSFDIFEVCIDGVSSGISPSFGYGAAKPYTRTDDTKFNCLAYALGETEWRNITGYDGTNSDVYAVAELLFSDLHSAGYSVRMLQFNNSPIYDDEVRIAMRIGESDFHFMVQHNDGTWSHKPGATHSRLATGMNPSEMSWDQPKVSIVLLLLNIYYETYTENYYNSPTVYFAISQ